MCVWGGGGGGGEGGYEGVRVEGGWKSLTGIVVGENQLFGVREIKITDRYCGG